jgi:hypothetical protein
MLNIRPPRGGHLGFRRYPRKFNAILVIQLRFLFDLFAYHFVLCASANRTA